MKNKKIIFGIITSMCACVVIALCCFATSFNSEKSDYVTEPHFYDVSTSVPTTGDVASADKFEVSNLNVNNDVNVSGLIANNASTSNNNSNVLPVNNNQDSKNMPAIEPESEKVEAGMKIDGQYPIVNSAPSLCANQANDNAPNYIYYFLEPNGIYFTLHLRATNQDDYIQFNTESGTDPAWFDESTLITKVTIEQEIHPSNINSFFSCANGYGEFPISPIREFDGAGNLKFDKVKNANFAFFGTRFDADFGTVDLSSLTSATCMLQNNFLTTEHLNAFVSKITSKTTNTAFMFANSWNLESIASESMTNIDLSKVTDAQGMFANNRNLKGNFAFTNKFPTSNCNMSNFLWKTGINTLDVTAWNPTTSLSVSHLLSHSGSLTTIKSSMNADWSTIFGNVTVFEGCRSLKGCKGTTISSGDTAMLAKVDFADDGKGLFSHDYYTVSWNLDTSSVGTRFYSKTIEDKTGQSIKTNNIYLDADLEWTYGAAYEDEYNEYLVLFIVQGKEIEMNWDVTEAMWVPNYEYAITLYTHDGATIQNARLNNQQIEDYEGNVYDIDDEPYFNTTGLVYYDLNLIANVIK